MQHRRLPFFPFLIGEAGIALLAIQAIRRLRCFMPPKMHLQRCATNSPQLPAPDTTTTSRFKHPFPILKHNKFEGQTPSISGALGCAPRSGRPSRILGPLHAPLRTLTRI